MQYRKTPLEGTLAAWSKPSIISADTQSGPWMWGTKKVPIAHYVTVLMSEMKNWQFFSLVHRLYFGLGGVWGKSSHRVGAGYLLWLLHCADRHAPSTWSKAHYSWVQPRLCCGCPSSHCLGRVGGKGTWIIFSSSKMKSYILNNDEFQVFQPGLIYTDLLCRST